MILYYETLLKFWAAIMNSVTKLLFLLNQIWIFFYLIEHLKKCRVCQTSRKKKKIEHNNNNFGKNHVVTATQQ